MKKEEKYTLFYFWVFFCIKWHQKFIRLEMKEKKLIHTQVFLFLHSKFKYIQTKSVDIQETQARIDKKIRKYNFNIAEQFAKCLLLQFKWFESQNY